MIKILIWNIRGIASKSKRTQAISVLKSFVNSYDVLVIIESHCSISKLNSCCKINNFSWLGVDSVGRSGGIALLPLKAYIKVSLVRFSKDMCVVDLKSKGYSCQALIVYGRFNKKDNEELMLEANKFKGDLILGDFNRWKGPNKDFVDGYMVCGVGGHFTRVCGTKKSRIDKVFVHSSKLRDLKAVWHRPIPSGSKHNVSDHKPIEVCIGEAQKKTVKEWRFPDHLLMRKDFKSSIKRLLLYWVGRTKTS